MKSKLWLVPCTLIFLTAACQPAALPAVQRGAAQAWIDAPLDEATLPLVPYDVIAHATNAKGIALFEFSVNGRDPKAIPPDPGAVSRAFAQMHLVWNPPIAGDYLLRVRAADAAGAFGPLVEALVHVGQLSPTPSSTATPIAPASTPTRAAGTGTLAPAATNTLALPPPPTITPTPTRTPTRRLIIPPGLLLATPTLTPIILR